MASLGLKGLKSINGSSHFSLLVEQYMSFPYVLPQNRLKFKG
jgi:hypothetical protein